MSEVQEVQEVQSENTLIDSLKQQYHLFCMQRDQAKINFHQLEGAIYSCETLIKKHEEEKLKKEQEKRLMETPDGETHLEGQEQTS